MHVLDDRELLAPDLGELLERGGTSRRAAIGRDAGHGVFGNGSIVSLLTEHGLIDEYRFVVTPTLLGTGQSVVRDVSVRRPLSLVDATAYPSGNVLLRYQLAGG